MSIKNNKGGTFKGNSHANGGIEIVVKGSGQQIEVEGNEPLISNEALQSNELHEYYGTNFQILDQVNKSCGAKGLSEAATEVFAGDVIICKATLQDKTPKILKGTHKQIISAINTEVGCNVIEPGGTITDKDGTQQFKDGGEISLYFKQGVSDKEYHVQMNKVNGGYVVNFQYGRRGKALQTGTKTPAPVTKEKAQSIYDKLVKSKVVKGYSSGDIKNDYPDSEKAKPKEVLILPQLLNVIDDAEKYIQDDAYVAQEKKDGERRMSITKGNEKSGVNKKGFDTPLPQGVKNSIRFNGVLDGEIINNVLYVFDLLDYEGKDFRNEPLIKRLKALDKLGFGNSVSVVPTAYTTKDKQAMFDKLKKEKREGIVFKLKDSKYTVGRPSSGGAQLKHKFYKTATFIVADVSTGKRSVGLDVMDDGKAVFVGKVTIPQNKEIPSIGDLIEVRYLYAYKGGSIYQPIYLNKRNDSDLTDATIGQLVYKAEEPIINQEPNKNDLEKRLEIAKLMVKKNPASKARVAILEKMILKNKGVVSFEEKPVKKLKKRVYVDFMNKDKGYETDRKYFTGKDDQEAYEKATKWAKNEFEKFHPDMINYIMAEGGRIKDSELSEGIKIEKEHLGLYKELEKRLKDKDIPMIISKEEFFKRIAEAHLKEIPNYYTLLDKMEADAEKKSFSQGGGIDNLKKRLKVLELMAKKNPSAEARLRVIKMMIKKSDKVSSKENKNENYSPIKFFKLDIPINLEQVEKDVDNILGQYGQSDMANHQVESYLNEVNGLVVGLGQEFLLKHKLKTKPQFIKYIKNRYGKARKPILAERKKSNREFDKIKAEANVNEIMRMAHIQSADMDKKIKEYYNTHERIKLEGDIRPHLKEKKDEININPKYKSAYNTLLKFANGDVDSSKFYLTPEQRVYWDEWIDMIQEELDRYKKMYNERYEVSSFDTFYEDEEDGVIKLKNEDDDYIIIQKTSGKKYKVSLSTYLDEPGQETVINKELIDTNPKVDFGIILNWEKWFKTWLKSDEAKKLIPEIEANEIITENYNNIPKLFIELIKKDNQSYIFENIWDEYGAEYVSELKETLEKNQQAIRTLDPNQIRMFDKGGTIMKEVPSKTYHTEEYKRWLIKLKRLVDIEFNKMPKGKMAKGGSAYKNDRKINIQPFVRGRAIIKEGRKIIAKITNRKEFFKNPTWSWDKKYPYMLEIPGYGSKESGNLDDIVVMIRQYTNAKELKKSDLILLAPEPTFISILESPHKHLVEAIEHESSDPEVIENLKQELYEKTGYRYDK